MANRRITIQATTVLAPVSVAPSTQSADWSSVRQSLVQICASHDQFVRFFSEVFEELDQLAGQLLRRQKAWLAEHRRTESDLARRAEQLENEVSAVAAQREQLLDQFHQDVDQMAAVAAAGAAAGLSSSAENTVGQADRGTQRTASSSDQEAVEAQLTRLSELAGQLAETRDDLAQANNEMLERWEELQAVRSSAQPDPCDAPSAEQLRKMEQQCAELQQQRVLLEAELDSVRNRAAELAETLAAQQRQWGDERARWAEELKRMRRLLEMLAHQRLQSESIAERDRSAVDRPAASDRPLEEATGDEASADPVLGSVMAQFEMLQKDLARRREKTSQCR